MRFSIIVPVYNKEEGISTTIKSVLSQSFCDYELVLVDDGSRDKSVEKIKKINDKRIRLITQENGGPSKARNTGVSNALGDWILYLDADDSLEEGALAHFDSLINKYPNVKGIACNYYVEENSEKKLRSRMYNNGIVRNNFRAWFFSRLLPCQGSYILKREVAIKYPFPLHLRRWEDACMLFDIFRNEKIARNQTPVFTYHRDLSAASSKCKNPELDFICNLNPMGKSFWERMCLYRLYLYSKDLYPEYSYKKYGDKFDSDIIRISYMAIEGLSDILIWIKHKFID